MPQPVRFAFLVHPLAPFHRRVVGVRRADLRAALGLDSPGLGPGALCTLGVGESLEGTVVTVPWLPPELLDNQQGAVDVMVEAVQALEDVRAVGLGSLLAVVAGRGEALASRVDVPVTTGAAATAWAAAGNAISAAQALGVERVAVLGVGGAVGQAVARLLQRSGLDVVAGGGGRGPQRRAEALGIPLQPPLEAVSGCRVVVGAATSGGGLPPSSLQPGTVLLDVALPSTLGPGRIPPGVRVLAGEAVELPDAWRRGFWGWLYHMLSGYGPSQIFACLAEPMVMAATGRERPFAQGREVLPEDLDEFAESASSLGLKPRLAVGWSRVDL